MRFPECHGLRYGVLEAGSLFNKQIIKEIDICLCMHILYVCIYMHTHALVDICMYICMICIC